MNRLNYKLREARREILYLSGLVKLRNGGLREHIDPLVDELYTKSKEEVKYLVAIRDTIRKGYKKVDE